MDLLWTYLTARESLSLSPYVPVLLSISDVHIKRYETINKSFAGVRSGGPD